MLKSNNFEYQMLTIKYFEFMLKSKQILARVQVRCFMRIRKMHVQGRIQSIPE